LRTIRKCVVAFAVVRSQYLQREAKSYKFKLYNTTTLTVNTFALVVSIYGVTLESEGCHVMVIFFCISHHRNKIRHYIILLVFFGPWTRLEQVYNVKEKKSLYSFNFRKPQQLAMIYYHICDSTYTYIARDFREKMYVLHTVMTVLYLIIGLNFITEIIIFSCTWYTYLVIHQECSTAIIPLIRYEFIQILFLSFLKILKYLDNLFSLKRNR